MSVVVLAFVEKHWEATSIPITQWHEDGNDKANYKSWQAEQQRKREEKY